MYTDPSMPAIPTFSGKKKADNTWAWITRQQYQDYLQRFVPLENELMNMTTYNNPVLAQQEVDKGTSAALTGFNTALSQGQQTYARYGAAISQDQMGYQNRVSELKRSAAIVDAANRIRAKLIDQNREIALGLSTGAVSAMGEGGSKK